MKKLTTILIFSVIVVLLGVSIFASSQLGFFSTTDTGTFDNQATYIGTYVFGTLTCQQSLSGNINVPTTDFNYFSYRTSNAIQCSEAMTLNDGCTATMKMPSKDDLSDVSHAAFIYNICEKGVYCNTETASIVIDLKDLLGSKSTVDSLITVQLTENQYIIGGLNVKDNTFSAWEPSTDNIVGLRYNIRPYQILREDVFSSAGKTAVSGSLDCSVNNVRDLQNYLITGLSGNGDIVDEVEVSEYLDINNLRQKGASVSYISNIVPIVPQYDLFENGDKYCTNYKIYEVETIETIGGTYKIANTLSNDIIDTVDCCTDYEAGLGNACVNFEIVPASDEEYCSFFSPCKYATGSATADGKYITQECIDNVCVTDIITVECNFNSDCGLSGYCSVDASNPKNNECLDIGTLEKCGNGKCEKDFGETYATCSLDCQSSDDESNYTLLIIIASIVIVVLLGTGYIVNRKSGGSGPINLG